MLYYSNNKKLVHPETYFYTIYTIENTANQNSGKLLIFDGIQLDLPIVRCISYFLYNDFIFLLFCASYMYIYILKRFTKRQDQLKPS